MLGRGPGSGAQYADIERHAETAEPDGVKVLRIESAVFFANADSVRACVREHARAPGLGRPCSTPKRRRSSTSSRRGCSRSSARSCAGRTSGCFARDVGQVRDVLRRASSDPNLQHVYRTVDAAIEAAQSEKEGSDG